MGVAGLNLNQLGFVNFCKVLGNRFNPVDPFLPFP